MPVTTVTVTTPAPSTQTTGQVSLQAVGILGAANVVAAWLGSKIGMPPEVSGGVVTLIGAAISIWLHTRAPKVQQIVPPNPSMPASTSVAG